ncbi:MAG: class I SAM-dependent methyltransferase [Candidatus Hydrogenedentes bacterium]|nr:class I SAM-dependent methyltransferase [Candidatus Hydrogenedentota bacterium]
MDLFGDLADRYDLLRSDNPPYLSILLCLIRRFNNKLILDLGCGTGNISEKILKEADVNIIGLDLSASMLGKFNAKRTRASLICASAENIPLTDSSVDGIMCIYLIHLLKEPKRALKSMKRMLNKGWILIVSAPHHFIKKHPLNVFFPSFRDIDLSRFPSEEEIVNWLADAGFSSIETQYCAVFRKWYSQEYLEKTKSRFISTLKLLPEEEFKTGLKKMEKYIENEKEFLPSPWESFVIIGYV